MLYFFILHFTDKKWQSWVFETGSVRLVETQLFTFFMPHSIYINGHLAMVAFKTVNQ